VLRGGQYAHTHPHTHILSQNTKDEKKANNEPLPMGCFSDAFQKREKANEDYAIRQREKEKLLELKKKLAEQQAHLKQLSDHMYVPDNHSTTLSPAAVGDAGEATKATAFAVPAMLRVMTPRARSALPVSERHVTLIASVHSDEMTKEQGGEHN
jgi:hypothetical protein